MVLHLASSAPVCVHPEQSIQMWDVSKIWNGPEISYNFLNGLGLKFMGAVVPLKANVLFKGETRGAKGMVRTWMSWRLHYSRPLFLAVLTCMAFFWGQLSTTRRHYFWYCLGYVQSRDRQENDASHTRAYQGMDTMIVEVLITNCVYDVRLMKKGYLDHLRMQIFSDVFTNN